MNLESLRPWFFRVPLFAPKHKTAPSEARGPCSGVNKLWVQRSTHISLKHSGFIFISATNHDNIALFKTSLLKLVNIRNLTKFFFAKKKPFWRVFFFGKSSSVSSPRLSFSPTKSTRCKRVQNARLLLRSCARTNLPPPFTKSTA